MGNWSTGKNAIAICQRSGLRFPYKEMVFEPGTGLFVHYTESDGMYNRVDHPQLHIKGVSDKIALENPRPDINDALGFLIDEFGGYIIGLTGFAEEQFILAAEPGVD